MSGKSLILIALITFGFTSAAMGQIRIIPRERIDSISNPRLSRDSAVLAFDTRHIVADTMAEDDAPRTFVFSFTNTGDHDVRIDRIVSTCSCMNASSDNLMVSPGEKAEISVRYDPKGHPGKFERRIFLYTGGWKEPSAVLKLSTDVQVGADKSVIWPVQIGNIRLRRSEVTFVTGRKGIEELRFINLSGKPIKLQCETAFLPKCLSFRTEPEVVEDGGVGHMVISYDPAKGMERSEMKIMLKGLGVSPSRSVIEVRLDEPDELK